MKLTKQVLSEMFIDAFMNYIEESDVQLGDYIPSENDLATMFGISRTSVREGIMRLKSIGILSSSGRTRLQELTVDDFLKPKDAILYERFLNMTKTEMRELLEIRKLYECYALEQAMKLNYDSFFESISKIYDQMHSSVDDTEKYIEYDAMFHRQILLSCKNSLLVKFYDFSWSFLYQKQFEKTAQLVGALVRADKFHESIYTAIKNKDIQQAKLELQNHLDYMITEFY